MEEVGNREWGLGNSCIYFICGKGGMNDVIE
jgi:hypothetical protein